MEVSQIAVSTAAIAAIVNELQAINEAQMAIMKSLAESQIQMSEMLRAAGIGQNINVSAQISHNKTKKKQSCEEALLFFVATERPIFKQIIDMIIITTT